MSGDVGEQPCTTCGRRPATTRVLALPRRVFHRLAAGHRGLDDDDAVCDECVDEARAAVMRDAVAQARGTVTAVDEEVIAAVRGDRLVSADAEEVLATTSLPGSVRAERVADVVGSWPFVAAVGIALAVWVVVNVTVRPLSPWPTAFLSSTSAVLASLAALQGPVILMSQRRRRALDRVRAELDYRVNLKAELEVKELGDRVDRLLELAARRGPGPEAREED